MLTLGKARRKVCRSSLYYICNFLFQMKHLFIFHSEGSDWCQAVDYSVPPTGPSLNKWWVLRCFTYTISLHIHDDPLKEVFIAPFCN